MTQALYAHMNNKRKMKKKKEKKKEWPNLSAHINMDKSQDQCSVEKGNYENICNIWYVCAI
jgi:hypothetical protein